LKRDERIFSKFGLSLEEFTAHVTKYGNSTTKGSPLCQFMNQRSSAGTRGIGWELTFAEWWRIWQESDHYKERGRGYGYQMARLGNSGPYAAGNVEIITGAQNSSDSFLVKPASERAAMASKTRAARKAA
jgi:hypothetical protein